MKKPTHNDDWLIPAMLAVVGAIPVLAQIAAHTAFGVAATVGLLMLVLAAAGLGAAYRRREGT